MDDDGWIIIIPLSTIGIFFAAAVITGAGIVYAIQMWFTENLVFISKIAIGVAIINSVISSIAARSIIYGLSSTLPMSQLIFFIIYGGTNLPDDTGFTGVIWTLFVFILYVAYGVVNIMATFGINYIPIIDHELYKSKKPTSEILRCSIPNCVVCAIGWIMNAIIFLLLPVL